LATSGTYDDVVSRPEDSIRTGIDQKIAPRISRYVALKAGKEIQHDLCRRVYVRALEGIRLA
jgi:hypothetical protein